MEIDADFGLSLRTQMPEKHIGRALTELFNLTVSVLCSVIDNCTVTNYMIVSCQESGHVDCGAKSNIRLVKLLARQMIRPYYASLHYATTVSYTHLTLPTKA